MKIILMMLFLGLSTLLNSQETLLKIKTNSSEIKGKMSNSVYQQDRSQFEKLVNILNYDVIRYFNLGNQYNAGPKMEAFLKSEDYETLYLQLKELKSGIDSATYCLDFIPDYLDEKSVRIKYNPEAKTFSVSNEIHLDSFYDDPEYIQLDHSLFRCPNGIGVKKRNINYACVDMVAETISFEINDPLLASKIEENRNFLRLLFVFNISGTATIPGRTTPPSTTDYFLTTYVREVVAYNSETNDIYFTYKFQ